MTDIQEKLLQLMEEIDRFCQKEKLHYVLYGKTAARAKENGKFTNSAYEFQILMPLPDILKLKVLVEEASNSARTFESWENNTALPQMVFRYTDTNSLLIDGWTGTYHTKPGIAVTIFAAKTKRPDSKILSCERYLQMCNAGRKKYFWVSVTIAKILKKLIGKTRTEKIFDLSDLDDLTRNTRNIHSGGLRALFHGKENLGKYIVCNQANCSPSKIKRFWFLRKDGKLVKFPKNLFSSVRKIRFERRRFPIPKKLDEYLEVLFDEDWETEAYKSLPISNRIYVISDSNMPYKEYLNYIGEERVSLSSMGRDWTEYHYWMETTHDPKEEVKKHTFQRVRRSVDRIDTWYNLRSKRDVIRTAYQTDDIEQLKFALEDYLNKTDQYAEQGIGFYIDSELFDCAKLVWEADGKTDYADQVYALVPELYKNETVDEYLASRGVTVD